MLNYNQAERDLLRAAESLADSVQSFLDNKPESRQSLVTQLHVFRTAQILVDRQLSKDLDAMAEQHEQMAKRALHVSQNEIE